MSKILITGRAFVDVYVDTFEEGQGEHVNYWTVNGLQGVYDSIEDLLKRVNQLEYIFSADKKDYDFIDGRICTSALIDKDNTLASDKQIEDWKQGKEKLYVADFNLHVQVVPDVRDMTENDAELMGIDF